MAGLQYSTVRPAGRRALTHRDTHRSNSNRTIRRPRDGCRRNRIGRHIAEGYRRAPIRQRRRLSKCRVQKAEEKYNRRR